MTKKNSRWYLFLKKYWDASILDQLRLTCQIPDLGHETLKPSKKQIKNY
jgi:hypothetical protein